MFKEIKEFLLSDGSFSIVSIIWIFLMSSLSKLIALTYPFTRIKILFSESLSANLSSFILSIFSLYIKFLWKNLSPFILEEIIWLKSENFHSSLLLLGKPELINFSRLSFLYSIFSFVSFRFWKIFCKSFFIISPI